MSLGLLSISVARSDLHVLTLLLTTVVGLEKQFPYAKPFRGTLLHLAILEARLVIIELLVAAGASIEAKSSFEEHTNMTPLLLVVPCKSTGYCYPPNPIWRWCQFN